MSNPAQTMFLNVIRLRDGLLMRIPKVAFSPAQFTLESEFNSETIVKEPSVSPEERIAKCAEVLEAAGYTVIKPEVLDPEIEEVETTDDENGMLVPPEEEEEVAVDEYVPPVPETYVTVIDGKEVVVQKAPTAETNIIVPKEGLIPVNPESGAISRSDLDKMDYQSLRKLAREYDPELKGNSKKEELYKTILGE